MTHGIRHWSFEFSDLNLGDEFAPHFYPCLYWLEAEGLIRVHEYARTLGGIASGSVENLSLTSQGFAYLGRSIDLGDGAKQLSETVREVSAGHGSYAKAGNFSGGFLAAFIKSFG